MYDIDVVKELIKSAWIAILGYLSSLIIPINDFIIVILVLATFNILFGLAQDKYHFEFKKAIKSLWHLAGYLFVLLLSVFVATMLHIGDYAFTEVLAWVTGIMVWFYATNIFKNWNLMQPENKVISIIYYVLSFKIIEHLKWVKDWQENEDNKKKERGDSE